MGAYPVGGKIHGATVTGIETRVYLDNAGKAEYIDLFEPPAPPPQANAAAAPNKDTDPFAAELANGIKKLSEHNYELSAAPWNPCWATWRCSRARRASCPR
jgi:hypothetical protein